MKGIGTWILDGGDGEPAACFWPLLDSLLMLGALGQGGISVEFMNS